MSTFEITSLQTEEAAVSGWTVAGAVAGVGLGIAVGSLFFC